MSDVVRLAIVGTGGMARTHARSFRVLPGVELVAAVEPQEDRLNAFCDEQHIPHRFSDLDSAIRWGEFDAAANVTPDAVHHPTTMKLVEAGKHVLCEKPLATTYPLALEMTEAAEKRGVINMVNLTYRGSPAVEKAREIVVNGEIGEIRHFEASYLQSWLVGNHWGDWQSEDRWLWRLSSATWQPRRHRRHRHPHRRLRHLCLRQRHRVDGKPRQDLPQGRRRAHRRLCAGRQRFLRHVGRTARTGRSASSMPHAGEPATPTRCASTCSAAAAACR